MFFKNREKRVLSGLLAETEGVILKDIFNLHFYETMLAETVEFDSANKEKWNKEFLQIEGELRELQGKRDTINRISGTEEFKKEKLDEIEKQRHPLIDQIQPLHAKIQEIDQYSAKVKECRKKLQEMNRYIQILKKYIKNL